MQSEDDTGQGDLGIQPAGKEKEWIEHPSVRLCQLESSLKQAKEENCYLRERYQQLRVDFEYNLALLDERDGGLERYDVITARAVTAEHSRLKELKQLQMQVDRLEESATKLDDRKEELSKTQHNNTHHRLQLDELKHSMACEMEKQTAEWERAKLNLQQRIQELEGQLTLQRQEMTAGFDNVLRQWEHEFNLKIDEIHAMMVSLNLKVPWMIVKEIKALTAINNNRYEDLVLTQKKHDAQLEAQHQSHTRELQKAEEHIAKFHKGMDVLAAQVSSLQEDQQESMKHKEETMQRYENLVRAQKKYDAQLEAQRQSHTRELQKAEKHIAKLHKRMEVLAAQVCRSQADQHEALKQREDTIQRLCTEVKTTQNGWENYISHVSSEMVGKNTEMITLQKRQRELQTELERKIEEIERYKQQRRAGLSRETFEQLPVQAELASQRHCEDKEAKHYHESEQILQHLTQARDQRDCVASEAKLQEQINFLWALVNQMKKDMESFSHLPPICQAQAQVLSPQCSGAHAATSIIPPAQTTTRSPDDQFTNSLSKVSPAEGHSKPSPVTEHEVRVEHKQSAGLNSLVRQLQKENLHMRRQLASGEPPYMRTRLKQAAFHIARLSREKQQLIEIGNHLGSELINAGLQEPEKLEDLSTKEQGDQHVADNRLSFLEQLQYKLTTQELQQCLRQRVSIVAEEVLPGTNNQGAANPRSPSQETTDRSESSLNVGPQPHSGLRWSELSSGESLQSLRELWEMLEPGHSSAIFSEGELCKMESDVTGVEMMIRGIGVPIHSRPTTEVQQRVNPYTTPSNPTKTSSSGTPGRTNKIRNYNIKD